MWNYSYINMLIIIVYGHFQHWLYVDCVYFSCGDFSVLHTIDPSYSANNKEMTLVPF